MMMMMMSWYLVNVCNNLLTSRALNQNARCMSLLLLLFHLSCQRSRSLTTTMQTAAPPQHMSLNQPIPIATHALPIHASASQGSLNPGAAAGGLKSSGGAATTGTSNATSSSSSLVNPATLALSLPHSNQSIPIIHVDSHALHYLTLEMPNALRASTRRSLQRRKRGLQKLKEAGFSVDSSMMKEGMAAREEEEDEVIKRLEMIGSHVGANFAERLSRDRMGFTNTLDVLKFICKEVWTAIWDKQVDNLRTNHRGVYVLQDNVFKPLLRISLPITNTKSPLVAAQDLAAISKIQLAYPVGIIRGALSRLGVTSTVVAETNQIPQCTFHVKTTTQRP